MIRTVPRENILEAITHFDSELRNTPDWQKWEHNAAYKYAIEYEGRRYPVKQIISMATGTHVNAFSGGGEANEYAQERGFDIVKLSDRNGSGTNEQPVQSLDHWIFQSNPKYFDAANAVCHLSEMTWLITRHKDRIHQGDIVFIWESGDNAGIIATATVISAPAPIEQNDDERLYNKAEERFDGPRLRVKMHIDHVLSQRLLRSELKNHPALATLSIFRMATGTNFELTPEQGQLIQELISRKSSNSNVLPPNVRSWSYKPDELDLIGIKRIDWSMFNDGTHIPQEYHFKFDEANGGETINLGESHPVTLILNGSTYQARIYNFNRQNYTGNSYTLRWENNQELHQLLKDTFGHSYQYITAQRGEQSTGTRPQVIVPDQIAEYMAFYKTETPFTYRAELRPFKGEMVAMTITQSMSDLIRSISDRGFIYEPWQIAAYVTALRTKPFIILAGVTGTGKSKLPKLVTTVTGGVSQLIPVRPDWTDSSEILGYIDLQGKFRPGKLLTFAQVASAQHDRHHVAIIDEMNLARVEHYFAEVLSGIEDRTVSPLGGFESCPLLNTTLSVDDQAWQEQCLPPNMAIVGTVNMDESAHGFSRKVLDRAFTLELSDIELTQWHEAITSPLMAQQWPVRFWYPRAIQLAGLQQLTDAEIATIDQVITILTTLNQTLIQAQLQVGYRTRDEIALFALHAREIAEHFVTRSKERVDPIDLAILMKVLPRIVGGSMAIRRVLLELITWATGSKQQTSDDIITVLQPWVEAGRPSVQSGARYPRTAARLYLMLDRLQSEGYTSFWL